MVTGWEGPRQARWSRARGDGRSSRLTRSCSRPVRVSVLDAARRIPGDRPAGVYTTGQLQNLVHLHRAMWVAGPSSSARAGQLVGRADFARGRLRDGADDDDASHGRSRMPRSACPGRLALRVPVATRTQVVGDPSAAGRVESVVVENLDTGQRRRIECDTVVLTGDWIPDHELVRLGGIELDRSDPRADRGHWR